MFQYKVVRCNMDGHYKWHIRCAHVGSEDWVVVANMEGKIPIFHHKADAIKTAEHLTANQHEEVSSLQKVK